MEGAYQLRSISPSVVLGDTTTHDDLLTEVALVADILNQHQHPTTDEKPKHTHSEDVEVVAVLPASLELREECAPAQRLQDRLLAEHERVAALVEVRLIDRLERIEASILLELYEDDLALRPASDDLVRNEVVHGDRGDRGRRREALRGGELELGDVEALAELRGDDGGERRAGGGALGGRLGNVVAAVAPNLMMYEAQGGLRTGAEAGRAHDVPLRRSTRRGSARARRGHWGSACSPRR